MELPKLGTAQVPSPANQTSVIGRLDFAQFHVEELYAGSIPARAGEPQPSGQLPFCPRVYPRPCGGTQTLRK